MRQARTMRTLLVSMSSILVLLIGCEKSSEEMYKKAMSFYESGKYLKAVQLFELLIDRHPEGLDVERLHAAREVFQQRLKGQDQ